VRIWRAERAGLRLGRGTQVLAGVATAATLATLGLELARVWRRGSAPLPGETDHLLQAGRTAASETVEVFREGYRASSRRENTLFNLFASFAMTFAVARGSTTLIRAGRGGGVFRNLVLGDHHIHHFVPGFLLVAGAGGVAVALPSDHLDRWLAIPFGAGTALVLDEAALLLTLDDVYWTEAGVLSLQLSFGATAALAALALGVRLLRRGEPMVLAAPAEPTVSLREVRQSDIPALYEHQADPAAVEMSVWPARPREVHEARWLEGLAHPTLTGRTIVVDGKVGGHVVAFDWEGSRAIGYVLAREWWGRGVMTRALGLFLEEVRERPLRARVAATNAASIRVLEKNGFVITGSRIDPDDDVRETLLELR
jgi:RimJ/RimL family protein N-acetyltransferase